MGLSQSIKPAEQRHSHRSRMEETNCSWERVSFEGAKESHSEPASKKMRIHLTSSVWNRECLNCGSAFISTILKTASKIRGEGSSIHSLPKESRRDCQFCDDSGDDSDTINGSSWSSDENDWSSRSLLLEDLLLPVDNVALSGVLSL